MRLKEPPEESMQAFIPAIFGRFSLTHKHKEVGEAPNADFPGSGKLGPGKGWSIPGWYKLCRHLDAW